MKIINNIIHSIVNSNLGVYFYNKYNKNFQKVKRCEAPRKFQQEYFDSYNDCRLKGNYRIKLKTKKFSAVDWNLNRYIYTKHNGKYIHIRNCHDCPFYVYHKVSIERGISINKI